MTQIVNPASAVAPATTVADVQSAAQPSRQSQAAGPDPADLRLVIEDDQAAGCFVYKTVDWRTGEVVQQIPREQLLKLREDRAYLSGDVIKTEA
jgi:flagellar protein FlaG